MNLEIKILNIDDFANECSRLQKFNRKSQHIKSKQDGGIYPIILEGKHFNQNSIDSLIEFLVQNARSSNKHKKIAFKTICILKGIYCNKREINQKLEKSLEKVESIRLKKRKRSSSTDQELGELEDVRECKKRERVPLFTFFCRNNEEVKVDPSIMMKLPYFSLVTQFNEVNSFELKQFPKDALEIVFYPLYGLTRTKNTSIQNLIWGYRLADFFLLEEIKKSIGKNIKENPDHCVDGLIFIYEEMGSSLDSSIKIGKEKEQGQQQSSIEASLLFLQQCYLHQMIFQSFPTHQKAQEIIPYFEALAEKNDPFAQTCLAHSYSYGLGVEQNEEQAVKLYIIASEQGYAPAQNNLAFFYHTGFGVSRDAIQAFEFFTRASEQGYAPAQTNLAICYVHGLGGEEGERKAVELYTQASEQGYAPAQNNLALYCRNDKEKKIELLTKASKQGYVPAHQDLAIYYKYGFGYVDIDLKKAEELEAKSKGGQATIFYNIL